MTTVQPASVDEIRRFQKTHVNWLNQPLDQDGILGPQTQWAMALAALGKDREDLVRYAISFQGKALEKPPGSNDGPIVRDCLAYIGLPPGHPWCCALICYILRNFHYLGRPKLGRVKDFVERFQEFQTYDPIPGDLGYIVRPDGTGHIFMVIGVSQFEVMTLEGNVKNQCLVGRRDRTKYGYICIDSRKLSLPGVSSKVPDLDGAGDR